MDALSITFNPVVDRMFIIVLALLFFVYGVTAISWIFGVVVDVWHWIRKTPKPAKKSEQSEVRYEVQWSIVENFEIAQTRIASTPELATIALIQENGEGYIRYRPFDGQREWAWGVTLWRYRETKQHYGVDVGVLFEPSPEWLRESYKLEYENQLVEPDEDPNANKANYIMEWSNNADFSKEMGGITETYLTKYPEVKTREIIESLGSGYIRYCLSDDTTGSWIPNGYVTKETLNNA